MADTKVGDQYAALGVDASKESVRAVFKNSVHNDFPGAFINIVRSKLLPGIVKTQHGDGDGSKSILRLLMYFLTGDVIWLYGMVDDAWSMNFGDVAAGGFTEGEFMITDILNLNAFHVPKQEMLEAVNVRVHELIRLHERYGFSNLINVIHFLGGETADLPRQVQTSVFDITVSGLMREEGVIKGNVEPGDQIWGFASDGRAVWEKQFNSGIMSNGLTMGVTKLMRPDLLSRFPSLLPAGMTFEGRFWPGSPSGISDMTIAEALLSPTRQWAIVIKILIDKLKAAGDFHLLHGISLNSGGGATKVSNIGIGGIIYRKHMPEPSPLFQLIQKESGEIWEKMFRNFNCGVGIDIVGEAGLLPYLVAVSRETGVDLYSLGICEKGEPNKNGVVLETQYGTFPY